MELLLIRHGQSEADLLHVHEGKADFPLTKLGENQAIKMADYVSQKLPPELIITSPLKRAKKTALILQSSIGCSLLEDEDLKEYNNGVLAGVNKEEAKILYPLPENGRPWHIPIEEGESELDFRFRAERVFHRLLFDYGTHARIAVVSHGGMISNLIKAILKLPNTKEFGFMTGDTGMHLLETRDDIRLIKFLNRQDHLIEKGWQ